MSDPNSEIAKKLWLGFPQCFSSAKVLGPVPLSALRAYANADALKAEGHTANDMLESYGALKYFSIPTVEFTTNPNDTVGIDTPREVPIGINKNAPVGTVVAFERKLWVIVENNHNPGVNLMVLAPFEYINIDA